MHYFTIRYEKEKLKEIQNYLQYDTNATRKDTIVLQHNYLQIDIIKSCKNNILQCIK